MKYLITGLGNVGNDYRHTRHNIGFEIVDAIASQQRAIFKPNHLAEVADISYKGRKITLIKPATYMNLSGRAVRYWLQKNQIPVTQLLVIVDDLHLPFGKLRLRPQGSDAGHNGMKNINEKIGTKQYPRLRFGIGNNFYPGQQGDYVLAPFKKEEMNQLPTLIDKAVETTLAFCWRGIEDTMQRYNR